MNLENDIYRFIEAQDYPFCGYAQALKEIQNGRKTTHWIWYIFPQFRCLGRSNRAHYYGIADRDEAQRYLEHPVLGDLRPATAKEVVLQPQFRRLSLSESPA